jgi:uncharacterized protein YdhG (YjbR/CyaY superfamily)
MADSKSAKAKTSRVNWSEQEREAIREAARDKRRETARLSAQEARAQGEREVQAKIDGLPEPDKSLAQRVHQLVASNAPMLVPRTFYGMPAYAKDGKVIVFFKPASQYKQRYATLGFEQNANIDEGVMWATSFGLTKIDKSNEKVIADLIKKAVTD